MIFVYSERKFCIFLQKNLKSATQTTPGILEGRLQTQYTLDLSDVMRNCAVVYRETLVKF